MKLGVWKMILVISLAIMFISFYILLDLRIIQKPYKWIISDVTKDKYTTYDKENDILRYNSDEMNIEIEHIKKEEENLEMWIATIKINNAQQLKSAFAGGEFSQDIKKRTSVIAKENEAVLAIDGAAVGFNKYGVVIRNNITYRISPLDSPALIIDEKGDFKIYDTRQETIEAIPNLNVMHAFDFGPILVKDGELSAGEGEWFKENKDPRTAIGQKGELEYVIIVADGRSKKSSGLSCYDLALEFKNRGCNWAYNLDGGGSTTLYFNGQVLNNPSDIIGERRISDILYFTN